MEKKCVEKSVWLIFSIGFLTSSCGIDSFSKNIKSNKDSVEYSSIVSTPNVESSSQFSSFKTGARINVNDSSLDFGYQVVGDSIESIALTISNISPVGTTLNIVSMNFSDSNFFILDNNFPKSISPNKPLEIHISMKTLSPGKKIGDLTIISNDSYGNDKIEVNLVGYVEPAVQFLESASMLSALKMEQMKGINFSFETSEIKANTTLDYPGIFDTMKSDLDVSAVRFFYAVDFKIQKDKFGNKTRAKVIGDYMTKLQELSKIIAIAKKKKIHVTLVVFPVEPKNGALPESFPPKMSTKYSTYENEKEAGAVPPNVCDVLTDIYKFNIKGTELGSLVDVFEIGNEVNMDNYWMRGVSEYERNVDYIDSYLKPASDCLRKINSAVKIANAGYTSQVVEAVKTLVSKNGEHYIDYVAVHLYVDSLSDLKFKLSAIEKISTKPIIISEWSYGNSNIKAFKSKPLPEESAVIWAEKNKEYFSEIRNRRSVAISHYFSSLYNDFQAHGKCGIFKFGGTPDKREVVNGIKIIHENQPFYNSMKNWH